MLKKELEEKIKELERNAVWSNDTKFRYNKLQNILLEKLNPSIDERLELCSRLYASITIKKLKDDDFLFETPIQSGWSSYHAKSIEAGINKLLNYQINL